MDIRKKNLLLAALIASIAVALYAFSIYMVISSKGP
jgi:hypothetical protein